MALSWQPKRLSMVEILLENPSRFEDIPHPHPRMEMTSSAMRNDLKTFIGRRVIQSLDLFKLLLQLTLEQVLKDTRENKKDQDIISSWVIALQTWGSKQPFAFQIWFALNTGVSGTWVLFHVFLYRETTIIITTVQVPNDRIPALLAKFALLCSLHSHLLLVSSGVTWLDSPKKWPQVRWSFWARVSNPKLWRRHSCSLTFWEWNIWGEMDRMQMVKIYIRSPAKREVEWCLLQGYSR